MSIDAGHITCLNSQVKTISIYSDDKASLTIDLTNIDDTRILEFLEDICSLIDTLAADYIIPDETEECLEHLRHVDLDIAHF